MTRFVPIRWITAAVTAAACVLLSSCGGSSDSGGGQSLSTLAITSGPPPGGTVGYQYDTVTSNHGGHYGFTLLASGGVGTVRWAWAGAAGSSLPPGLTLAGNVIGGAPVGSAGSYSVIVTATDSGTPMAQVSHPYTIRIVNPPPPALPTYAVTGPPGATLNQPYSYQFQFDGYAPLTFSTTGALPPGLGPLTATGLLAGTPTSANLYPITLHVTDPTGQTASQTYTIGVFQHGFSPTGGMQALRTLHTATLLANGQVLVTGGEYTTGPLQSSELYTPASGSFAATAALHVGRTAHTATLLCDLAALPCTNSSVLVVGGSDGTNFVSSAELYDAAAATFTLTTGSLATPREYHTATRLQSGKVLIAGGTADGTTAVATAELFDPATGTFSATAAPMTSARIYHTATLLADGRVLIAGGVDAGGVPLDSAELYDPVTGAFSTIASPMTVVRKGHTATLLPGGKVLIAGGLALDLVGINVATAELYDPAAVAPAASFTMTGALVEPRWNHTAALLPSGQVLIAGGAIGCDCFPATVLQHAELYDPASGLFASTGAMQSARFSHTMTSLGSSGAVLVVGGQNSDSGGFSTAEVYQ